MERSKGSFVDPVQRVVRQTECELQHYSSVCLLDAAPRPDNGGREGKTISVVANLFPVKFNPDLLITQFDVRIVKTKQLGQDGEKVVIDIMEKRPIMLALFKLALGKINELTTKERIAMVYDGAKNAFTCTTFPFPPGEISVEADLSDFKGLKKGEKLKMTIKKTSQFSINAIKNFISATPNFVRQAQKATNESVGRFLQVFNIAFRMDLLEECHSIKNERFFDPEKAVAIAQGAEIWRGFYQSVSAFRGGLFVNLDLTNRPFMCKGPFLEVAAQILERNNNNRGDTYSRRGGGGRGDGSTEYDAYTRKGDNGRNAIRHLSMMDLQKLRKALRDVKIGLVHRPQGRSKTFRGFTGASARAEMFHWNGKEISVAEYYLAKYGTTLNYPDLPCAILGQHTNNPEKKQWVPLELCLIVENKFIPPYMLSAQQSQDMLRVTKQSPAARLHETIERRKERAYESNERLTSWGIEVGHKPVQLQARLLQSPQVSYRDGNVDRISNGTWNLRSGRFLRSGVPLITPVILNFTRQNPLQCEEFTLRLFSKCRQLGMVIAARNIRCVNINPDRAELKEQIKSAAMKAYEYGGKQCVPQLFICFMDSSSELYQQIKRISILELFTSVPSQCMDVRKAFNERGEGQYMTNIAMKINDKLSGFNQFLANPKDLPMIGQKTMMIGIDVRHPPARLQHDSVVAAVATLNGQGTQIASQICTQFNPNLGHQQETVLDGKQMFIGLLNIWKKHNNGLLPEQIIVFRDGVSQGEYMQVTGSEITQLKQACIEINIEKDDQPKITYVIATKKHHLRMFAQNERDLDPHDKSGNLPAGTVADQVITHPFIFEFYLQTHTGIGCCRPCKYTVLYDDIKFTSDAMQRLVNSLCYTHQRATRAVSQPPLVKYAHTLADKAMFLLYPDLNSDTSSLGGSVRNMNLAGYSIEDVQKRLNKSNIKQNNPSHANLVDIFSEVPWFM